MHFAIQKLHWSPSQITEWLDADPCVKAFYYASISVRMQREKEEAAKMKTKANKGRKK